MNRLPLTNTTVMGAGSKEVWNREPEYAGHQWGELLPQIRSGAIDPPIDEVFSLEDTAPALRAIDERRAIGRLIVRVREIEAEAR